MRVPTGVHQSLTGGTAPDFSCVKVRASADLVLAALAPHAYGMPRDLLGTIRGAPLPGDGRDMGRRAVLYRLERDEWSTVIREGDRLASFDPDLAERLSRSLATRAFTLHLDGSGRDLAYCVYDSGQLLASYLSVEGETAEIEGAISPEFVSLDPATHAKKLLEREDATNDRVVFRHFELPGLLRGRWDLSFERAVLVPELPPVEAQAAPRPKTQKKTEAARGMTREGQRGVQDLLAGIIAETTRGF